MEQLQRKTRDCGLLCLSKLYKYWYKKSLNIESMQQATNYEEKGINLLELKHKAKQFGLDFKIMQGEWNSFVNLKLEHPIIIVLAKQNLLHTVVVTKKTDDYVVIFDPAIGKLKMKLETLQQQYASIIIDVTKTSCEQNSYQENSVTYFQTTYKYTFLNSIMSLLVFGLSILASQISKYLLNSALKETRDSYFLHFLIILGFCSLLKISFSTINEFCTRKIVNFYLFQYQKIFNHKLLYGRVHQIQKYSQQDLIKIYSSFEFLASYRASLSLQTFANFAFIVLSGFFLVTINFKITLLIVCAISFLFLVNILANYMRKKPWQELLIKNSEVVSDTLFVINNFQQTRMQNVPNFIFQTNTKNTENQIKATNKFFYLNSLFATLSDVILAICPVLIIYLFWYSQNDNKNVGDFLIFVSYYNFLINPAKLLANNIAQYSNFMQASKLWNSFNHINLEIDNKYFNQKVEIKNITIKNLAFGYSEYNHLFKIGNLELKAQNHLIGKNGCGKSTFLKLLLNFFDYHGSILFDGVDIQNLDTSFLRTKISYINSSQSLFNNTIANNIHQNNPVLKSRFEQSFIEYNLQEFFDYFKLSLADQIVLNGENFSAGQKQFIQLLKLFANENEVVLLDECFENIDLNIFEKLKPFLQKLLSKKIVIEVSHSQKYIFEKAKVVNFDEFKA
ncbi:cysteine peptidase family C39 domain-containing protein [Mycoplasma sp. 128]